MTTSSPFIRTRAGRSWSGPARLSASTPSGTCCWPTAARPRGALSSHRVALARGADGAVPHRHDKASELFFILSGELDVLAGDDVITAAAGDLLVVPPGLAHAFGAHRGSAAEALIVITPGVERFDYFRHVVRLRAGAEPREILLALQDRFDTHFVDSAAWHDARAS